MVALLLFSAGRAGAGDGAEFSTDCRHTYVNKAVGKEQWAITWDLVSRVSGNVFKRDGSMPSFVECHRRAVRDPGRLSFECYGASSCAKPPCSQKWKSLGAVTVPESFFYPKGVDPRDPGASCAPDRRVCPEGCPFSKIGDAIAASPPGSFLHVGKGTYQEVVEAEGKPFTLYGEPGAVLVSSPSGALVPALPTDSEVLLQMDCRKSGGGLRRIVGLEFRGHYPTSWFDPYPYTGGIVNVDCDVAIEDSTLVDNYAGYGHGGGVSNDGALLVARTTFVGNGGSSGGAIANEGVLDVVGSVFRENHGPAGPDYNAGGGAIFNGPFGDAVLEDSLFDGNTTASGCCTGGAILNWGTIAISRSVIENSEGSAVTNWGSGRVTVRESRLERNSVDGAILNPDQGSVTVEDSIVAGNTGRSVGGIDNGSELVVRNSKFIGNSTYGFAAYVGGLLNREGSRLELDGVVFEANSCSRSEYEDPCPGALRNFRGTVVAKDLEFRDNVPIACEGVDFVCE